MFPYPHKLVISELTQISGVGFGTSGVRGLVRDMSDVVCYAYTCGFLQYLRHNSGLATDGLVGIAGDLRPSSPRIMEACAQAVQDLGLRPLCCGYIPTPAVANWGLALGIPTLMVTGSHIPDERNGIKFNKATGEILKVDEVGIQAQQIELPTERFDATGSLLVQDQNERACLLVNEDAAIAYLQRYLEFFPAGCLAGLRVALYEHSSVAREVLREVLTRLGALVTPLGRSERFIPVDTEAIRPEDRELAHQWTASGAYDCIVSTDGDGDRPLVADERGEWLRGDILGVLTAKYLGAAAVVTPVSSNTTLELSGWFPQVLRTRIGSPFVLEGMNQALARGLVPVMGYEANGGFLLCSPLLRAGCTLATLPTRDAMIVILSVLLLARERGCPVSHLPRILPQRFTASERLKNFPLELSRTRLTALTTDTKLCKDTFAPHFGSIAHINTIDGLRLTFTNGEILHVRPSGNAPELRIYTEANSQERAEAINRQGLNLLETWRI